MSEYYSCDGDPAEVAQIANRFGFCLVKNLFTAAEVKGFEHDLAAAYRTYDGNFPDLYSCPTLRGIMLDPRIINIAKALLGDTLVYYRETSLVYEDTPGERTHNPFTELHCDARGTRQKLDAQAERPPGSIYQSYRFGIYFRNYRDFSGGLKVAPGSHLQPVKAVRAFARSDTIERLVPRVQHWFGETSLELRVPPFNLYNVPSMPGDVVIFSLRCFHAAGAIRFKDRPEFATLPPIERGVREHCPQLCQPIPEGSRNAIFFDYGGPSEDQDFYTKWRALMSPWTATAEPSYEQPSDPAIQIRNDKIITGLALRLAEPLRAAMGQDAVPEGLRKSVDALTALCRAYKPHSPFHPVFDQAAFLRHVDSDPIGAVLALVDQVAAGQAALTTET